MTGAGVVQYIALIQQPDKDKKKKDKTKAPPQKTPSETPEPTNSKPSATELTGTTSSVAEPTFTRADTSPLLPPPLPAIVPQHEHSQPSGSGGGGGGGGVVGSGSGGGGGGGGGGGVVSSGTTVVGTTAAPTATTEAKEKESEGEPLLRFSDRESQRLASETQRLLQCHAEHAMTIEELVQSFAEAEDPAQPRAEELSLCLHKHNVRRGGSKAPRMFQVRSENLVSCSKILAVMSKIVLLYTVCTYVVPGEI